LGHKECVVKDWRVAAASVLKMTGQWHFQFKSIKRIILTRSKSGNILVRGEANFKTDVGKPGRNVKQMTPLDLPLGVPVKPAKLKDVNNLMTKQVGKEWLEMESLSFYKTPSVNENIGQESNKKKC
jgi:hypothetical protein